MSPISLDSARMHLDCVGVKHLLTMPQSTVLTGVRVLIVDDEPDSAFLLQFVLELEQAEVVVTHQVSDALEAVNTFEPDVILSDIMMPEVNGLSLIRVLRDQGKQTPAIAVSAAVFQQDKDAALAAGYDRFIEKPIDPSIVIATIVELLESSSTSAESR